MTSRSPFTTAIGMTRGCSRDGDERLDETAAGEFKSLGVTMHLAKPFTEAQLVEVLKNIFAPK